jgi:hypothetical protein
MTTIGHCEECGKYAKELSRDKTDPKSKWICNICLEAEQKKMASEADIAKRRAAEAEFWGNCYDMNALGEIVKQTTYAYEMGIFDEYGDENCDIDLDGASVIDIGSGPWSLLLRCYNTGKLIAVDPVPWPPSVFRRYKTYGIGFINKGGEDVGDLPMADEVWIYNCLQHVEDPVKILENAKKIGRRIRIFEWLNTPVDTYHLHTLTEEMLRNAFADVETERARTIQLTGRCQGTAFVGSFKANPIVRQHVPKFIRSTTGPVLGRENLSGY